MEVEEATGAVCSPVLLRSPGSKWIRTKPCGCAAVGMDPHSQPGAEEIPAANWVVLGATHMRVWA
jgi:hypothetical protein